MPWLSRFLRSGNAFQVLYISVLLVVCVIRAITQAVAGDEAWLYERYLNDDARHLFDGYDACNHFLHTYLCFCVGKLLGFGAFYFRIPSLLGALFYMVACLRLCNWAFPNRYWSSIALIWLTLNPFILDFMVAATGYGLALALLTWLIYYSARFLSRETERRQPIGYLAALTAGANLAFSIPAAAVVVIIVAVELWRSRYRWIIARALFREIFGPAVVTFVILAGISLSKANGSEFYYGAATASDSFRSLVRVSLEYTTPVLAHWKPMQTLVIVALWCGKYLGWILLATLPLAILSARDLRRGCSARADTLFLLLTVILTGSLAVLFLAHNLAHVLYPLDRTGLYLISLAGLYLASAGAVLLSQTNSISWAGVAAAIILCAQILVFAAEWNTRYFYLWKYDAHTREIARMIAYRHDADDERKVTIGATYIYASALKYYVRRFRMPWVQRVDRSPVDAAYDFYVLSESDASVVEKRHLKVIYRDTLSGAVLARPADCADLTGSRAVSPANQHDGR